MFYNFLCDLSKSKYETFMMQVSVSRPTWKKQLPCCAFFCLMLHTKFLESLLSVLV